LPFFLQAADKPIRLKPSLCVRFVKVPNTYGLQRKPVNPAEGNGFPGSFHRLSLQANAGPDYVRAILKARPMTTAVISDRTEVNSDYRLFSDRFASLV
jgi:hypothetical protein